MAQEIETENLLVKKQATFGTTEAPTGMTLYDPAGKPHCIKVNEDGSLTSTSGVCGSTPAPQPSSAAVLIDAAFHSNLTASTTDTISASSTPALADGETATLTPPESSAGTTENPAAASPTENATTAHQFHINRNRHINYPIEIFKTAATTLLLYRILCRSTKLESLQRLGYIHKMAKLTANSLTATLLKAIAAGGILVALLVAPNIAVALKPFLGRRDSRAIREQKRQRIKEAIKRLRERRLVEIIVKSGKEYLQITELGKRRLREFEIDAVVLARANRWDKKWRLVMFDIPERKRKARQALQMKLNQLGFLPVQKSVFAYPYACNDEVDFIVGFFGLEPFVIYCESDSLGQHEVRARRHFNLL